jgi:hypothetical protein
MDTSREEIGKIQNRKLVDNAKICLKFLDFR